MAGVTSCCGYWDLRAGARNIAIISMIYDLLLTAALLLILLIHVPMLPWEKEPSLLDPSPNKFIQQVYQILLIVTISVQAFHLIPSFLLLYSTWEEISRGVCCYLFVTILSLVVHVAWLAIPFFFGWKLDRMVIHVTFTAIGILIMIYFIICVSSYSSSVQERNQDYRAKRRLKEDY